MAEKSEEADAEHSFDKRAESEDSYSGSKRKCSDDPTYQQSTDDDEQEAAQEESLVAENNPVRIEEAISADACKRNFNKRRRSFGGNSPDRRRPKCENTWPPHARDTGHGSWFLRIMPSIRFSVNLLTPKSLVLHKPTHLELREARKMTLKLLAHLEAAIDTERDTEIKLQRQLLEEEYRGLEKKRQEAEADLVKERRNVGDMKLKLAQHQKQVDAEALRQRALLLNKAAGEASRQRALFDKERENLKHCHKQEREASQAVHEGQLQELKRKLEMEEKKQKELEKEMEKQKAEQQCRACKERPPETVVIPCLHAVYCFDCLLEHRTNNNLCPKCDSPILGICTSTAGAANMSQARENVCADMGLCP